LPLAAMALFAAARMVKLIGIADVEGKLWREKRRGQPSWFI